MAEGKSREVNNEIIKKYTVELKRRGIEIVGIYLFGSYADGEANKWSDVDIAILTRRFIGDCFDFKFILMKIAREFDVNLEPHPFIVDEFTEDNPLAYEVMKTGERII